MDNGWRIELVEGRRYLIISHLHYSAAAVTMRARSRTTGKPDASTGTEDVWHQEFDVVEPEEPVEADLSPTWAGAPLPFHVHVVWHDDYGERFDTYLDVPSPRWLVSNGFVG
jgi:hypothetical protein